MDKKFSERNPLNRRVQGIHDETFITGDEYLVHEPEMRFAKSARRINRGNRFISRSYVARIVKDLFNK